MIIRCPKCQTAMELASAPQDGAAVKCPNCGKRIRFKSKSKPKPRPPITETDGFDRFDDFEEFEKPDPPPRRAPQRRTAARSRRPPQRREEPQPENSRPAWLLPLAVAGGGLAVISLTIIAVVLLVGRPKDPEPDNVAKNDNPPAPRIAGKSKFVQPAANETVANNPPPKLPEPKPIALPKIQAPIPTAGGGGQLKPDVLDRVKKATVLLRVTAADGSEGTGSGFFAVDKSVIITNAHVVGMLEPGSGNPRKLEVVLDSGETTERVLAGRVTAVDRTSDLAVVQFRAAGDANAMPDPLKVFSAGKLRETQSVYVFGFPFGEKVGKNITVSTSSVSSLRKDKTGVLKQVQVNGGMNPGNSGGPVVDSNGNVIGVAVSGIPGTQINFAIPGDRLYRMLDGRISGITIGEAKQVGKQFQLPLIIKAVDPLKRLQKIHVTWWVGKQGKPRGPSTTIPSVLPDDSNHQTVNLTYQNGRARGFLMIPPVPEGKTVFIQPAYETASGNTNWMMSVNFDPGPLLDQLTVLVSLKPRVGRGDLHLNTRSTMQYDFFGGKDITLLSQIDSKLIETTLGVTPREVRKRLTFDRIEWGVSINKRAAPAIRQVQPYLPRISFHVNEDAKGVPKTRHITLPRTDSSTNKLLVGISSQVLDSLDLVAIPIEGRRMKPGTRWTATRRLPVNMPGASRSGFIYMTYTYKGVATYYRHRVAVIGISGRIPVRNTQGITLTGTARGNAYIDLSRDRVIVADLSLDMDLIAKIGADKAKASGQTRVKLSRIPPDWKKLPKPRRSTR